MTTTTDGRDTLCDSPGCFRNPLVNGLCDIHLDETGWARTKPIFVPAGIREWLAGWLADLAGQRNDAVMGDLAERIGRMPVAARDLAVNAEEAWILRDEIWAYDGGGGFDSQIEDKERGARRLQVMARALELRAYQAASALDRRFGR